LLSAAPAEGNRRTSSASERATLNDDHQEPSTPNVLANLIAKYDTYAAYQIAEVHTYRGDSNKSFEWLERASKQRDTGLPTLNTDPLLKNLRHNSTSMWARVFASAYREQSHCTVQIKDIGSSNDEVTEVSPFNTLSGQNDIGRRLSAKAATSSRHTGSSQSAIKRYRLNCPQIVLMC
jgi:hypothetical protein